jgi:geranylgeranylglycerol-phosphate geranylgeranyltransferase
MTIKQIRAFVTLCRPGNMLLSLPVVALGGLCVDPWVFEDPQGRTRLLLAAGVTALALAAGNVQNDLADQAEDRINRPGRPLPAGMVSTGQARGWARVLVLASLLFSVLLGMASSSSWPPVIALLCLSTLALYARCGKQWILAGNLLVALLGAMAVVYGALAVSLPRGASGLALSLAGFALGVTFIREILKDGEDLEGDRRAGRRTLPMVLAPSTLKTVLMGVLGTLPLLALWLGLSQGHRELGIALLIPLGLGCHTLWRWQPADARSAARAQRKFKLVMSTGLLAYGVFVIWMMKSVQFHY